MLPSLPTAAWLGASAGGAPADEPAFELEPAEVAVGLSRDGATTGVRGRVPADHEAVGLGAGVAFGAAKKAYQTGGVWGSG